jgi:hypothetical protein
VQNYRQVRVLQRPVISSSIDLIVPEPEPPRRSIERDESSIKITLEDVWGRDLRCLIDIERQIRAQAKDMDARAEKFKVEAQRFKESKNIYVHEDDIFTEKETIVLSLMTHCKNIAELSEVLGVSTTKISKILKVARERVGVTSSSTTAYMDLMLIAIALKIAPIDHIPEGNMAELNSNDKEMLADYYGPDIEKRENVRRRRSVEGHKWSRLYTKLGLDQYSIILYAVKEDIIELPDPTLIKKN